MTLRLADSTRNAEANAITAMFDAGSGPATIEVRTGTQPATPATAASGTLLCTFTCSDPSFGAAAAGVITLATVAAVTAVATGTAGWFRAKDSTGAVVMDGAVATSGQQLNLSTVSITSGGTVQITSGSITCPM